MSHATRKGFRLALVIALGVGMIGVTARAHDPGPPGARLGWLGIVMYGSSGDGTTVKGLVEDGPAAKAGLKKGDRIRAIDGVAIEDYWDITNVLRKKGPGDSVGLEIVRDGEELTINVTLGERPRRSHQVWVASGDDIKLLSPGMRAIRLGGGRLYLGVDVHEMSDALRGYFKAPDDAGVLVNRVIEGTPAEKAGIRTGDVIIEVDGKQVRRVGDISSALRARSTGDAVSVVVIRDGGRKTVEVTLKERDELSGLRELKLPAVEVYAFPQIEGLEALESLEELEALEGLYEMLDEDRRGYDI